MINHQAYKNQLTLCDKQKASLNVKCEANKEINKKERHHVKWNAYIPNEASGLSISAASRTLRASHTCYYKNKILSKANASQYHILRVCLD
jgi:hypothetical protein